MPAACLASRHLGLLHPTASILGSRAPVANMAVVNLITPQPEIVYAPASPIEYYVYLYRLAQRQPPPLQLAVGHSNCLISAASGPTKRRLSPGPSPAAACRYAWFIKEDPLHRAEEAPNQAALSVLKLFNDLRFANEELRPAHQGAVPEIHSARQTRQPEDGRTRPAAIRRMTRFDLPLASASLGLTDACMLAAMCRLINAARCSYRARGPRR